MTKIASAHFYKKTKPITINTNNPSYTILIKMTNSNKIQSVQEQICIFPTSNVSPVYII